MSISLINNNKIDNRNFPHFFDCLLLDKLWFLALLAGWQVWFRLGSAQFRQRVGWFWVRKGFCCLSWWVRILFVTCVEELRKPDWNFFWENVDIQLKHGINRLLSLSALAYIDLYFLCLCVINRLWIGAHFLILGQKARKIATAAVMRLSNWCKFAIMPVMHNIG